MTQQLSMVMNIPFKVFAKAMELAQPFG